MCLAHEGTPYGHLSDQVGALLDSYLASKCRISVKRFLKAIDELKEFKRIYATADGILYVPRMVRDEEIRLRRANGGKLSSGNPKLAVEGIPPPIPSVEIDSCARVRAHSDSNSVSPSVSVNGFKKLATEDKTSTRVQAENGAPTEKVLIDRYREFIKLWSEPTEDGRVFTCADVDLGGQIWISLVDSGQINAANVEEVFAGLKRYKQSERWRSGYVLGVPSFLGWAKNGTPAAPRWNDLPKPAAEEY